MASGGSAVCKGELYVRCQDPNEPDLFVHAEEFLRKGGLPDGRERTAQELEKEKEIVKSYLAEPTARQAVLLGDFHIPGEVVPADRVRVWCEFLRFRGENVSPTLSREETSRRLEAMRRRLSGLLPADDVERAARGVAKNYPGMADLTDDDIVDSCSVLSPLRWLSVMASSLARLDEPGARNVPLVDRDGVVVDVLAAARAMALDSREAVRESLDAARHVGRPSWEQYFLKQAMLASERSTCDKIHVGCVLVRDNYVLSTGYNGSMPGAPHCCEEGHLVMGEESGKTGCVRTIHAEINAIGQAARRGVSTEGAKAYMTYVPCISCYKALAAAGIVEIYVCGRYENPETDRFIEEAGGKIPVILCDEPSSEIWYFPEEWPSAVRHRSGPRPRKGKDYYRCSCCGEMRPAASVCTECDEPVCHDCIAGRKTYVCDDCDVGIRIWRAANPGTDEDEKETAADEDEQG